MTDRKQEQNKDSRHEQAADLRKGAEEVAREKTAGMAENPEAMSPEELQHSLHELAVHRIELTMQNEELRRTQAELQASQARYSDLYDQAPVGYITINEQGLILEANLTAAELLGIDRKHLVGQPLTRFIAHNDLDIYYLYRKQLLETDKSQVCELRMVRHDGTTFWARLEATATKGADGESVYRVVMSNVTEHKQAEETIRLFKTVFDKANFGVMIADVNGFLTYLNECSAAAHGYEATELIGKHLSKLHPGEHMEQVERLLLQLLNEDSFEAQEVWHCRRDGSIFPTLMVGTLVRDKSGTPQHLATTAIDITSRKQAEEQIKASLREKEESEEKFSKAFQTSPYAITITRAEDGTFVEVNNAFISMTGFTREEALAGSSVGLKLWVNEEDRQCVVAAFNEGRAVVGKEYQFRTKTGKVITGLFSAQTIHLGHRPCILSSINDITSRKQAEEQIKASLREKEVLLQEIQHRVKNNLLTISGILALQLNQIKDDKSKDAFITSMNRVNALTQIHTRLYQSEDFSRIDLKEYIEELVRELARSYGFPQEDVITDVKDTSLDITTAIPAGLIVNELVSNAMKHAFPDGKKGQIKITISSEGSQSVLTVSDNGIGLPHHIDIRSAKSLGFLLIVQAVEQINGDIKLERENGTQCIVTFSVDQEKTP
ncbi:MAG: PAS domain S-box protein [Proteobacteria bacterium]|nr:PAS domain S-box protein [Pseudomonadota bacterium]